MDNTRTYEVGDPDPTVDLPETFLICEAEDKPYRHRYFCTQNVEGHHPTQHIAGQGETVAHVWPVA